MSQIEDHLRDALTDVADEIPADGVRARRRDLRQRRAPGRPLGRRPPPLRASPGRYSSRRALAVAAGNSGPGPACPSGRSRSFLPLSSARLLHRPAEPWVPGSRRHLRDQDRPSGHDGQFHGDNSATLVTAAADGRTFVIVAAGKHPVLYLARFNAATRKAQVRELRAPVLPVKARVEELALSPDGTKLAVGYRANVSDRSGKHVLVVADLKTGRTHEWSSTDGEFGLFYTLTWAADDTNLAFNWFAGWQKSQSKPLLPGSGVRMLDTALPESDLVASSRLVLAYTARPNPFSPKKDEATVSAGVPTAPWLTRTASRSSFP